MNENKVLPCIAVRPGEIHERLLTCGDPARAEKISKRLDDVVCVAKNREFWSYNGTWKGVPVTVTSHGVGAGGAAIAFELVGVEGYEPKQEVVKQAVEDEITIALDAIINVAVD